MIGGVLVLISLNNTALKNHDVRREYDIKQISLALKNYADKNEGIYPADLSELQKFFPELYLSTYFGEIDYKYKRINNNHYCLYTELESRKDVFFANEKEADFGSSSCTRN